MLGGTRWNKPTRSSLSIEEGPDKGKFMLETGRRTRVRGSHIPDYETQKTYSITIVATDDNTADAPGRTAMTKSMDVTITITNVLETGSVTFSQVEPQVSVDITASLSDPDGGYHRHEVAVVQRRPGHRDNR